MQRNRPSFPLKVLIGASMLASGSAYAHEEPSTPLPKREHVAHAQMVKPFFEELDCENLGYVQPGEVEEHIGPIFLSFDSDGSRDVDPLEWKNYPHIKDKPLMELSFSVADRNGDSVVSYREFTEYLSLAVSELDSDGNGELSPEELNALLPGD